MLAYIIFEITYIIFDRTKSEQISSLLVGFSGKIEKKQKRDGPQCYFVLFVLSSLKGWNWNDVHSLTTLCK